MADPITIIGTVGAISNIIDLVSKTINSIRDFRGRWKEADLAFLSLAAQLIALCAALTKIQEWSNNELLGDPDYQLIMDLDVSMSCCRLLFSKFDEFFFKLDQTTDEPFDFAGKVKFVFGTKELDDVQKMVERQIGALTLLLMACNCKTTSEQKTLLQDSKTRKVIVRVRLDSASLFVHRDSSSFISRWSDNLSKFSICFDFDRELFVTKVYERVFRSSVKDSLRRQHILTISREQIRPHQRTQAINRKLEEDFPRDRREVKVLLLGSPGSIKADIIKQMKTDDLWGITRKILRDYRYPVRQSVIQCAKALVEVIKTIDIQPEPDVNNSYYDFLLDYTVDLDPDVSMGDTVSEAIDALWKDSFTAEVLTSSNEFYLKESAPYFFREIRRIAAPDYIPTEVDVIRSWTNPNSAREHQFAMGRFLIHLIDVDWQLSERKKGIHKFDNVTSIMFVADLACYDQALPDQSHANAIMEQFLLFESVVNSNWFKNTSIILLLANISVFKKKVVKKPLENYFPDYAGGNDINRATEYFLWRFNQLNRAHLNLYSHLVDSYGDLSTTRVVFAAIRETILQRELRPILNPK